LGGINYYSKLYYFMKKLFLFVLGCCTVISSLYAQKITKEHYTVSGGLLGGANFSKFRIPGNHDDAVDYDTKVGWAAGGWVNFPIANWLSIEPQVFYSIMRYRASTGSTSNLLLNTGRIGYVSVPLLVKFHAGDKFAFTAGPQADFVSHVRDNSSMTRKSQLRQPTFGISGGFELFPHGVVTIFGRYVHGLTNLDDRSEAEEAPFMTKNSNAQAGLKIKLFGKKVPGDSDGDGVPDNKDKCPGVAGLERYEGCPIPDTDGDGINDEEDSCVNVAGTLKYKGCPIPDTDGDGINDEQDKCPTVKGIAKYNGCPIPDTDGDGVNDEEDKCPNQAGPASRNGCPVTDRDNDGVNDEEDRCPDVPGTAANHGCPEVPANVNKTIATAAQNITFTAGTAKLATKSNASLNRVVAILNENPSVKLSIEGHTDNAGNDDANQKLSEDRAAAVKAYFVSKGISEDRITSEGFGETRPIAENTSAAGRLKNRRVEIKVVY
jgi:outer membrane protein OmpA-like peptidoglycan-associated protein